MKIRKYIKIYGEVQGVGFRYYAYQTAHMYALTGWVRNCWDDTVESEVQGDREAVEAYIQAMNRGSRFSTVDRIETRTVETIAEHSFEIAG